MKNLPSTNDIRNAWITLNSQIEATIPSILSRVSFIEQPEMVVMQQPTYCFDRHPNTFQILLFSEFQNMNEGVIASSFIEPSGTFPEHAINVKICLRQSIIRQLHSQNKNLVSFFKQQLGFSPHDASQSIPNWDTVLFWNAVGKKLIKLVG